MFPRLTIRVPHGSKEFSVGMGEALLTFAVMVMLVLSPIGPSIADGGGRIVRSRATIGERMGLGPAVNSSNVCCSILLVGLILLILAQIEVSALFLIAVGIWIVVPIVIVVFLLTWFWPTIRSSFRRELSRERKDM